ncbi:hypothetical protein B0H10DRAFT_1087579 [Mycena sp. CBHHK59/15]|nr:hypothetical protein B0H10DRAFT_1087579 [Mycena sp. CBHHK59/15]
MSCNSQLFAAAMSTQLSPPLLSSPSASILLPTQPSTNSLSSTSTSASSSSASSSSSHTSASHTNDSTNTHPQNTQKMRRIRFAPSPTPAVTPTTQTTSRSRPRIPAQIRPPPPLLSFTHSPRPAPHPPPPPLSPSPRLHPVLPSLPLNKSSTWPKPKSFLRPFRRPSTPTSSTDSLTPTPSHADGQAPTKTNRFSVTTEAVLTLGTINLFRASSRDRRTPASSDDEAPADRDKWGLGLTRWSSASSATPVGSPLARTQSTQSTASTAAKKQRTTATKTKAKSSKPPPAPTPNPFALGTGKRGTRMLNGRVYGARGGNPFANARDEADPEFVEWGTAAWAPCATPPRARTGGASRPAAAPRARGWASSVAGAATRRTRTTGAAWGGCGAGGRHASGRQGRGRKGRKRRGRRRRRSARGRAARAHPRRTACARRRLRPRRSPPLHLHSPLPHSHPRL